MKAIFKIITTTILLSFFTVLPRLFAQATPTTGAPLNLQLPLLHAPQWNIPVNANSTLINNYVKLLAPLNGPTFTGNVTLPITGTTQCLHVNSAGIISGTGSDCGSGGGGGSPGGSVHAIQFNNTTFGGSNATLDQAGNGVFFSYDGTRSAFLYQSSPTSNNGLANALALTGSYAIAGPDYASVEYLSYDFPRPPAFVNGSLTPTKPPFADNTSFEDYRAGNNGKLTYNPTATQQGGPNYYDLVIKDNNSINGYLDYSPRVYNWYNYCCGAPGSNLQLWGSNSFLSYNFIDDSQNISQGLNLLMSHAGLDDTHALQVLLFCNGGAILPSDEGCANTRRIAQVEDIPFFGPMASTVAPGNNVFPVNKDTSSNQPGEGRLLIDLNGTSAPISVTSVVSGFPDQLTFAGTTIPTPDLKCTISTAPANFIPLPKGGTVSQTFGVTGCTGTILTTQPIFIAGAYNTQTVKVQAGGTSSITATLYNPVAVGDIVYQGPHAGYGSSIDANANGSYRDVARVAGCPSAHECDLIETAAGHLASSLNGSFSLIALQSGATLVRNGSGTVTTQLVGQDNTGLFAPGHTQLIVNSAANTGFNGTFTVLTNDGASPNSTITWAQAGGAATTTTSLPSYIKAPNGSPANQISLIPAVTVAMAVNPATQQMDGTVLTQEHNWTATAGDTMVSGSINENEATMDHETIQNITSPTPGVNGGLVQEVQVILPGDGTFGTHFQIIAGPNSVADYQRFGGTRPVTYEQMNITGDPIINRYFHFQHLPPPGGAVLRFEDCGTPNSSPFSFTDMEDLPGIGGVSSYVRTWHCDTQTMNVDNGSGHFIFSPGASIFENSGAGYGASLQASSAGTILNWTASGGVVAQFGVGSGQIQGLVGPTGSQSHVTQTATDFTTDILLTASNGMKETSGSISINTAAQAVFSSTTTQASGGNAQYSFTVPGVNAFTLIGFGTGNGLGLAGTVGLFDATNSIFPWVVNNSDDACFIVPLTNVASCTGAAIQFDPTGGILSKFTTAPTGSCPVNGAWAFSQDGHGSVCSAGTWALKI